MALLYPDTSEAEDFSQPIEEGTYPGKVVKCDAGKSKAGNMKIMPKLEISVNGKTRARTAHLVISGEGSMGFDQFLRACHFDELADKYRDPAVQPKPGFDTESAVGQELLVVVGSQLYKPDGGGPEQKRDQINGFLKK